MQILRKSDHHSLVKLWQNNRSVLVILYLIRNVSCGAPSTRRKWTITSTETNQILHVLLAMASKFLAPGGANRVDVTVRRRQSKGLGDFLLVNRLTRLCVITQHGWHPPTHG